MLDAANGGFEPLLPVAARRMDDLKPREPAVRDDWPRNLYGHSAKNAAGLGCAPREPAIDTFTLIGTGRGLHPLVLRRSPDRTAWLFAPAKFPLVSVGVPLLADISGCRVHRA